MPNLKSKTQAITSLTNVLDRDFLVRTKRAAIMCGSYDVDAKFAIAMDRLADQHPELVDAMPTLIVPSPAAPSSPSEGFVPNDYWPADEQA